jgi:hypothetical protein
MGTTDAFGKSLSSKAVESVFENKSVVLEAQEFKTIPRSMVSTLNAKAFLYI